MQFNGILIARPQPIHGQRGLKNVKLSIDSYNIKATFGDINVRTIYTAGGFSALSPWIELRANEYVQRSLNNISLSNLQSVAMLTIQNQPRQIFYTEAGSRADKYALSVKLGPTNALSQGVFYDSRIAKPTRWPESFGEKNTTLLTIFKSAIVRRYKHESRANSTSNT